MPETMDSLVSVEVFDDAAPDAGIYAWDVEKNLLFADSALAELFGLPAHDAVHGLPLEKYLERVHPEDRPTLAKIISTTIIADLPQQASYRVIGADGLYRMVMAFGRAFRTRNGSPVIYSGIVMPAPEHDGVGGPHH